MWFNKEHTCCAIHPFASSAVDGLVVALSDLTALGLNSALILPFCVVVIPMRSFLQCFPLQSLVCSLQSPSLFYSNGGLSCHSLPGADTYIVAKCISLLSDNPHLQMCPVCLCSYKLAPIELSVFLHMKVVNKSVCCPRKVRLVDIIVFRLLANLYDNHDALHLHFRWIDCFCGYMKGLRLALWLVIKMVILMEATGYSGPTLPQVGINPKQWLQVISS